MKNRTGIGVYIAAMVLAAAFATAGKVRGERVPRNDGATLQVNIDNFTFAPVAITVPAGTTVSWVNRDDIPHTVVSGDNSTFKSKALDTGDQFSFTFAEPGAYPYFCSIHPKMTGKVVVQ